MQNLKKLLTRNARTLAFTTNTQTRPFTATAPTFMQRWETIKEQAVMGGGQARIDKHHSQNKLTAR